MFNILRLRILSEWSENIKARDCISILIFIFLCSFSNVFVNIALVGINALLMLIDIIADVLNFSTSISQAQINQSFLEIKNSLLGDMQFFLYFILLSLIPLITTRLLQREKVLIPLTLILFIGFNIMRDDNVLFLIGIILILLFPLTWMIPIGSGKYFSVIEFLAYFRIMYPINFSIEKDLTGEVVTRFLLKVLVRVIVPMIIFVYLLSRIIVNLDLLLAIEIYFGIILFVFLNYSEKIVYLSLKRIVIYLLIVFLTIININNEKLELVPIVLSIFTILFSLNRVLSAINDIKKDAESNSCMYALDHRGGDYDWLVKNYIDFEVVKKVQISETMLLRQIVIHHSLASDSLLDLIKLYEELYKTHIDFVKQFEFMEIFENKVITIKEKIENYKDYFPSKSNSYSVIYAYIEYCFLLAQDKQYDECIELLQEWYVGLNEEGKYVLYYSYLQKGKVKEANAIKQNIDNFEKVKESFEDVFVEI